MSTKPLLGAPFEPGVIQQLQVRSNKRKSNNLTDRDLTVLHTDNAFVRISSGVIVNQSANIGIPENEIPDLAKNNILQGGVLSKSQSGFNENSTNSSYSKTDALGFRPMAGIDSVEIVSQNAQGTIRKTDVSFKIHTLEDLNKFEKLYLRPGFTVLLEYGHSAYYDNNGNTVTSVPSLIDFFNSTDQEKIAEQIIQNIEESSYNYDAVLGAIMNFQYSYNMDGGYDCTFYIISKGSLLESILAISSGDVKNTKNADGIIPDNIGSFLQSNNKKSESSKQDKSSEIIRILNDIYTETGAADSVIDTLVSNYPNIGFDNSDDPYYLGSYDTNKAGATKKTYITFNTLFKIINNTVMLESNGKKFIKFGQQTPIQPVNSVYITYDDHFSSNPNVCLLKRKPNNENFFYGFTAPDFPPPSGPGNLILNDILVDVSFLISKLTNLTDNDKEDRTVVDFLKDVFAEVQTALGNINEFDFLFREKESICYIVDRKITSLSKHIRSNILPCYGKGSLLSNISVTSKISNELVTMMAIGAQQSGANLQGYGGIVMNFNKGLSDRFTAGLKPGVEAATKTDEADDKAEKALEKIRSDIKKAVRNFGKGRSFKDSEGKSLAEGHQTLANYEINRSTTPLLGTLPFELTFTMKGIAGLVIGEGFVLQEGILPTSTQDSAGFIIKSINHSIQGNQWTTDITAFMTLAEPDLTKERNKKQFDKVPLDSKNQDAKDNQIDKAQN